MSEELKKRKHFLLEDLPVPDNMGIVLMCIFAVVLVVLYADSTIECAKINQIERGGVKVAKILREHHHAYQKALTSGDTMSLDREGERLAHALADFYRAGMISGWYVEVCISESKDPRYPRSAYISRSLLARYEPDFKWVVNYP